MTSNIVLRGLVVGAAFAAASVVGPRAAHADDREQCISAAENAQALRDEGKYRRAREQMLVCSRDVCPSAIKRDCVQWLQELDRDAPSVVVVARDGDKDIADVKVYLDGAVVADHLDGRPVSVDLGEHTFRFEHAGVTKEEKVLIGAGQKSRNISVNFGKAGGEKKDDVPGGRQEPGSIVPAVVVGSIGVIALGTAVVFGLQGKNDVDELQKCKPRCNESDVDSARTKLIISDISTGVGIVALGVAAYMFITRPKGDADAKVGATASQWRFDAAPVKGGAAAGFSARF